MKDGQIRVLRRYRKLSLYKTRVCKITQKWDAELEAWTAIDEVYSTRIDCKNEPLAAA